MSRINSILKMIFLLSKGRKYKISELAEELEVTERQIRRYKEELDNFFDIDSITGPDGGYRMKKAYFPFKDILTYKEIDCLKMAIRNISEINGGSSIELDSVIDKINFSILNNEEYINYNTIIPYSRPIVKSEEFYIMKEEIFHAMLSNIEVWIKYKGNSGTITERIIRPYKFITYKMDQYLIAMCMVKEEFREFKLRRILDYRILNKKFERDEVRFNKFISERQGSIGIYSGDIQYIKLLVKPPMANTISERLWVDNQLITENDDGSIIFEAKMNGGPEIISWILSMGKCVEVLEPKELVTNIKYELKEIGKMYK